MDNKKNIGMTGIVFLFAFIGISYLSAAQPFIPSEAFLNTLIYGAFPAGCILLIYKGFKKDRTSTLSVFQQELSKRRSTIKKLGYIIMAMIGIPLAPALMLFIAQWYPAWPSQYLYIEQVSFEATIIDFSNLRKVNRTKIYLKDNQTNREYNVHWPTPESRRLTTDATVRLIGKQNWFGRYIDRIILIND